MKENESQATNHLPGLWGTTPISKHHGTLLSPALPRREEKEKMGGSKRTSTALSRHLWELWNWRTLPGYGGA